MHGSAHDKAQQQRGVLLRRGKCVQRALRGVARLRTRRTLVVTAALVLLVLALLALCHARLLSQRPAHRDGAHDNAAADAVADDSTSHVAASPSDRWLLRPDAQHGGSVRVMLLMVSTRVDEQLCYALASAFFADLPVVVLGYGARRFVNAMKPSLFLDAMQRAGLRDRDVVLLLDSDILFSGEDMLPFIDDYIARSPAAPSALDVRAVRAGTARAPSTYAAEQRCFAYQVVLDRHNMCMAYYHKVDRKVAAYVARTGVAYDLHDESLQPLRYLSGGVSIHRVWSARELLRAYEGYTTRYTPNVADDNRWRSDQSVLTLFYNELRAWEVKHDVLRNSTAAATQRGPHGLRAGQLQLEQTGRVAFLYIVAQSPAYISDIAWRDTDDSSIHVVPYVKGRLQHHVDAVWQRYGGSARLRQRTLTRVGNATHTIELAPPLLYVASQNKSVDRHTAKMMSPLVWHITDTPKQPRFTRMANVMPWYVPMRYNTTKWRRGRDVVLSSHIVLRTANDTAWVRYGDVCIRHPFNTEQLSKIFVET